MTPIRVFLVDDHAIIRQGVRALLETQAAFEIVGEAESGEAALEQVPAARPDVVLMDLTMPGMSGTETAQRLHATWPAARLIALSMHEDPEHVQGFLEAGGHGYVPKTALGTQLFDAVLAVARGEYYAPARLLAELARDMAEPDLHRHAILTDRETAVVRHIARGNTYKEIAGLLGISEKTVATYRERAAVKLGVSTRAELVRWALEHGLIE